MAMTQKEMVLARECLVFSFVTGEGAGKYRYSTFGSYLVGTIREVVGICKMKHLH
jgi:hypothetical protein